MIGPLRTLIGRFRRDDKAVAAVEFALIMPFLLALYFGSMEASALFTADKRVNTISATVGDLVAQWKPDDGSIPSATMTTYFSAAKGIMSPYDSSIVRQVISLIFVKSDGTTKVLWSVANGTGATARTLNVAFPPLVTTSKTDEVARGGCVVAAETYYSYKPIMAQVFTSNVNLYHANYFIPRYGATSNIQLWNTSLASTACTKGS